MNEKDMAREIRRLDWYTLILAEKIDELTQKLATIEGPAKPSESESTASPIAEVATQKGDHWIIEDKVERNRYRKLALTSSGIVADPGEQMVITCDEINCAAADHIEVMKSKEARAFNSARVSKELESMSKDKVQFELDALGTWLADEHFVSGVNSYTLPSGRGVSVMRAIAWANSTDEHVPGKVSRGCDRGDCSAPDHLKVDR